MLHDFYVPDMRVKQDVVPGRYTEVWFTPTVLGAAPLHLRRVLRQGPLGHDGETTVDSEAEYKKWLETGGDEWKNYRA